ncbi:peptidoglycan/xylan/chitin deacetylase (PgdA/CDA1 family) [Friedmanniella endophytica]|uniref:Peptidoglycan/xylan/chitin deacetylase (PgdA/CDA1 family) n=1 Tax=Microlunatus kandeliicorticis TaxID=1759536 RepID=A0A7W3IVP2_9ACTN|nr:polysaccharide deacetylase family protein [Microlunatus kandeliicorticis]MBA8796148.1 peptidoglycan/xylan/chitin deacetylase (PgdA/CDA1 family) [Microlunatus kandeliicorticis]
MTPPARGPAHRRRAGRRPSAVGLVALASGAVVAAGYRLAFAPQGSVFGDFPWRGPGLDRPTTEVSPEDRRIALTFDDGPNEPYTSRLLDVLGEHGARATFFQVGRCAERFPSATRRVVAEGHLLGNHSYHHEFTRYLREPRQQQEIARAQRTLQAVAGVTPALYRPPWLCHWPWVLGSVRGHGLRPVSGLFGHPLEVFQPAAAGMADSAHRLARPGRVLIFHDGFDARGGRRDQTVGAVAALLPRLRDEGYRFVTVAELLGVPGYQGSPGRAH